MLDNFCLEFTKFLKKYPIQSCALFLVICFLLGDKFEKNFAAVGSVGSVLIGYGAYRISKEQQKATEQKISDEERKIIRNHYKKTDCLFLKIRKAGLKEDKKEADFYELEIELCDLADSAAVEMPQVVEEKMEKLFDFLNWAKNLETENLETENLETDKGKGLMEFITKSSEFRRELESAYAKYLKLPNPKP